MEHSNLPCTRMITITSVKNQIVTNHDLQTRSDHSFRYNGALEIVLETMRIMRCNLIVFMVICGFLILPVSAIHLSNLLVDQSVVNQVSIQLLLIAKSSGIELNPYVKQVCHKFSDIVISSIVYFSFYITLLLISKAAVVYAMECTYSRKKFECIKFYVFMRTIWRRIISTYLLICVVNVGCVTLFVMLLICVSRLLYAIGFSSNLILYTTIVIGLFFAVILAQNIIICDLAIVMSVLEDVSGPLALLRSNVLVKGQTRVGLMMFLGSTIGVGIVKGLFEHRVKSLSYGDESFRMWERPVLVVMYSFVVLIDFMMSTVFYFSCKSYSLEAAGVECKPVLETMSISLVPLDEN
ncbi:hypothetical protein CTI12_AA056110 [Artemisia annua]|uniref:Son of sevenless protein n=1 Tax=Artemisia annua TaxID=35608 RepID=A0A2U1Q9U4_ARTAN|nr:hypothetical protein CTI12_AA056110 [Artemisia annua]